MLKIKILDKISNQKVYEMVDSCQLTLRVQQRQMRLVGHCLRRDENDLINKYFLWAPNEHHGSIGEELESSANHRLYQLTYVTSRQPFLNKKTISINLISPYKTIRPDFLHGENSKEKYNSELRLFFSFLELKGDNVDS
jgi:hypothetical protein